MSEYPLFQRFHEAMNQEMRRHDALGDKGDWTKPTQLIHESGGFLDATREVDTVECLERALSKAIEDYYNGPESNRHDQLVDIANLCSMLWLHEEGIVK